MLKSKYKRIQEEKCSDTPCKHDYESAERQHGKNQCKDGLEEAKAFSENTFRDELIYDVEMLQAAQCSNYEDRAVSAGIAYKCTCVLPESLSDEELQELYDSLRLDKNSEFI